MVYGNKKNLMTPKAPTHCSNENETLFGQNGCNTTQREHTHIQKNDDDQQYIWVHNPHQLDSKGKTALENKTSPVCLLSVYCIFGAFPGNK